MNQRGKIIRLKRLQDSSCKRCSLHKSSKHICILGKGNVMTSILLLGEAPGSAEEKTGKPFMGRAGKLLNNLLELLEMLDLVYITNAARCRPPENRNPTFKELLACGYFLGKEIEIISPKIIIPMGRVAMFALGFADIRAGTKPFFSKEWQVWINPTFHPAYCLRRGRNATNDLYKVLKWAKAKSLTSELEGN